MFPEVIIGLVCPYNVAFCEEYWTLQGASVTLPVFTAPLPPRIETPPPPALEKRLRFQNSYQTGLRPADLRGILPPP